MTYYGHLFYKLDPFKKINMTKQTLSNKGRYSVLKLSGFRARMATPQGRKTIRNRRKKGRSRLTIQK